MAMKRIGFLIFLGDTLLEASGMIWRTPSI